MSKNDVTGDEIISRLNTEKYRKNFEAIFGKPEEKKEKQPVSENLTEENKNANV